MLLAEKFVLLALNADGTLARGASTQSAVGFGVTAALVTELAQVGAVVLVDGRITLTGSRPEHPLLAQVLDNLEPVDGKKLNSRLASIKHAGWREVVDGMVAQGVLGREKPGLLLSTRHPVSDVASHAQLLERVRAAALGDEPLDFEMSGLLALAGPSQLLEVVAPARADRPAAKLRIAQAAEQVPAAAAVGAAVAAATAAGAGVYVF